MTPAETAQLLAIIAQLDNRAVDDGRVAAWVPLLADVDFADAQRAVMEHFSSSMDYLTPTHIIRNAASFARSRANRGYLESLDGSPDSEPLRTFCGRQDCPCTHTGGCDAGWIYVPEIERVAPCQHCKPRAYRILTGGHGRAVAQRLLRESDVSAPTNPRRTT
jgi:hypothetical protein